MKKIVLLLTILFVSVLTTACINNFAVQELNNKAKEYLNQGETEKAICRLKSSLDLDSNMYETHYNLAIAYISAKNYDNAIESLDTVLELKQDFVDAYYSLGVSYEEKAFDILAKSNAKTKIESPLEEETQPISEADSIKVAKEIFDNLSKSIENYNIYLTKKVDATDKEKVNERIDYLNKEMLKYNIIGDNLPAEN